ncbi:MAG: CRISPR-associated endonuclease Cas2 [Myxococcales bacterium]|nr:CRISPR-associated endonuclease Cas2 [Myxococcales bacterium]MCB9579011.1 CRISPR-associated endonuclease Cas2 [Polyangiaceae bacterium]
MRNTYIVSYDISNPKRLRNVFKLMRGYGDHLQLSVFQCELNRTELIELRARLGDIINFREDQVLFVDVGPVEGRGSTSIRSLGRPYMNPERHAIVA